MQILSVQEINVSEYGKKSNCSVFFAHVKLDDIEKTSSKILETINDQSWISKLSYAKRETFESCMKDTVEKITKEIFDKKEDFLTESFGEYLISFTAIDVLEENYNHRRVPLAELLRDQKSGNPGFDFHSESTSKIIIFGEAKYSAKKTAHGRALRQIKGFITEKKDSRDLNMLEGIVSTEAMESHRQKQKGFAAAFSYCSQNINKTIGNILKSNHIDELLKHKEVYLIAIEI